jgi:hypothetical protein
MSVRQRSFPGVALAIILLLAAGLAQAAEFSATMVTKAGGVEIPGKIYVKDNKVRNEVQVAGQAGIHILRPDKQVVWIILPQQKAYMEMPFTKEAQHNLLPLTEEQKNSMKKMGTETINGYACDKYMASITHKGKAMQVTSWVATDLGMPIKIVSADGSFSMEYKDIKPGEVAASLFEVPQDYQKMKLPFAMPPAK